MYCVQFRFSPKKAVLKGLQGVRFPTCDLDRVFAMHVYVKTPAFLYTRGLSTTKQFMCMLTGCRLFSSSWVVFSASSIFLYSSQHWTGYVVCITTSTSTLQDWVQGYVASITATSLTLQEWVKGYVVTITAITLTL